MNALPTMISQMSILVRTLNLDGIMATEGMNILEDIVRANTTVVREASVLNPINMDVIGEVKAVERDFKEVPALVRLVRQDVGGKANVPEELLWSSERGAFSSGDTTEGAQEKQWETIKYIHRDVANQLKNVAMLQVVNALGKDRDVLAALPYTTVEFDNPIVANAEARAKISKDLGQAAIDLAGTGAPLDIVMQIISSFADEEFSVQSDWIVQLKERQEQIDAREEEKHEKDMELLDAQIELSREQTKHVGDASEGGSGGSTSSKGKILTTGSGGGGYSKLEQKKHEKVRQGGPKRESIQRRQGDKA
jgi:hypothetical protein